MSLQLSCYRTLENLYFSRYIFTLHALEEIRLPAYKGSTLRGLLGYGLKRLTCIFKNSKCEHCLFKLNCVYSRFMESPLPEDHPLKNKCKKAPHPYVIIPPVQRKKVFSKGATLSFGMIIVGKANESLPYVIYAISEMGKKGIGINRGKYELRLVESEDKDKSKKIIYSIEDGNIRLKSYEISFKDLLKNTPSCSKIRLTFETPLRIKHKGKLIKSIPFEVLIHRLAERAFLLANIYCSSELTDFSGLLEGANNITLTSERVIWIDWIRYSTRQKTNMKLGGIVGEIIYSGDLTKFVPLLKLGEYIHVGKATTFGLGKYRLEL